MVLRRNRIELEVYVYVWGYLMLMDHGEGGMYVFYYISTTTNIVSGKRNDKRAGVQAKPGSVTAPNCS